MSRSQGEQDCARPAEGRAFLSVLNRRNLPGLAAQLLFWSTVVVGVALDLWTKSVVFDFLRDRPGQRFVVIDGFIQLVIALNPGAAFGLFSGSPVVLLAVSLAAAVVFVLLFLFGTPRGAGLVHLALGLVTAGVCGNLYDRLFNGGYVRDFIDVVVWPGRHWPAFNVADSMLCIGVGLMAVSLFLTTDRPVQERARQHK